MPGQAGHSAFSQHFLPFTENGELPHWQLAAGNCFYTGIKALLSYATFAHHGEAEKAAPSSQLAAPRKEEKKHEGRSERAASYKLQGKGLRQGKESGALRRLSGYGFRACGKLPLGVKTCQG